MAPSPTGRTLRSLAAIATLLLPLASGCGSDGSPDPEPRLQALVAEEWAAYKAAYGVAVGGLGLHIVTPRGAYSASAGLGDIHVPGIHFRAASNTKTFTAAAIMLLYQEGRLNIDDAITSYIPGSAVPYVPDTPQYAIRFKSRITIRQLLSHMGGVFDNTNRKIEDCAPYSGWFYPEYVMDHLGQAGHTFTFDEMVGVNAACGLVERPPGERHAYTNIGYDLLGKIVERVSGMSYPEFVTRRLAAPNGLASTTFPFLGTDQELPRPSLEGHERGGGVIRHFPVSNVSANVAEGNVTSTPADLARWVKRLVTGSAGVSAPYVAMMKVCADPLDADCYGLGILHARGLGWGHNGANVGYVSLMLHNPDDDVTVIVFSNFLDGDHIAADMGLLVRVAKRAREELGFVTAP